MEQSLLYWDSKVLLVIQNKLRTKAGNHIFEMITRLGDNGLIWILISAGLMVVRPTRSVGMVGILAMAGSLLVNNAILKLVIRRTRPYEVVEGLVPLIEKQHDFSFPSGHTASSFAVATVLYGMLPLYIGIIAIVVAVLIAFSRLYLGVHYPTDVIGGMISGIIIGATLIKTIACIM